MPELLKCSFCDDPLTTDDNDSNLCGVCADSLKAQRDRLLKENANLNDWLKTWKESFNIAQAEITKLQATAIQWHKYPDEKPDIDIKCIVLFDDGEHMFTIWCGNQWFDIEHTWKDRITHWAYLPAPPEEDK